MLYSIFILLLSLTAPLYSATSTLPASKPTGRKWANSFNLLQRFQPILPFQITRPHLPDLKSLVPRKLRLHPRQLPHFPHFLYHPKRD